MAHLCLVRHCYMGIYGAPAEVRHRYGGIDRPGALPTARYPLTLISSPVAALNPLPSAHCPPSTVAAAVALPSTALHRPPPARPRPRLLAPDRPCSSPTAPDRTGSSPDAHLYGYPNDAAIRALLHSRFDGDKLDALNHLPLISEGVAVAYLSPQVRLASPSSHLISPG